MKITDIFKTVISILLAFLLSVSYALLLCAVAGKMTVLSGDYLKKAVAESGYGEEMHKDLYNHFVSWGAACNIGEEFFKDFFEKTFTPDFIENDAQNYLNEIYTNTEANVDTEELNSALRTALKEYAVKEGFGAQATLDDDVGQIADELCNMYKSYLRIPGTSTITGMVKRADKYINYALIGLLGAELICLLILFLFYKDKKKSLMYICSGFFGAFLMLLACPLYLRASNLIGKVNISAKALYSLIVTYVNGVLEAVIAASFIALICAVFFLIIYLVKAKKEA